MPLHTHHTLPHPTYTGTPHATTPSHTPPHTSHTPPPTHAHTAHLHPEQHTPAGATTPVQNLPGTRRHLLSGLPPPLAFMWDSEQGTPPTWAPRLPSRQTSPGPTAPRDSHPSKTPMPSNVIFILRAEAFPHPHAPYQPDSGATNAHALRAHALRATPHAPGLRRRPAACLRNFLPRLHTHYPTQPPRDLTTSSY